MLSSPEPMNFSVFPTEAEALAALNLSGNPSECEILAAHKTKGPSQSTTLVTLVTLSLFHPEHKKLDQRLRTALVTDTMALLSTLDLDLPPQSAAQIRLEDVTKDIEKQVLR